MDLHISLSAEELFRIGPIPVTNSMLTMFLVMGVVLLVFTLIARKATAVPTHGQSVIEIMIEFLMGLVEGTAGKTLGRRLLPLISGIFIFILFSNFSGLLPGMGTVGKTELHEVEEGGDHASVSEEAVDVQNGNVVAFAQEEHESTPAADGAVEGDDHSGTAGMVEGDEPAGELPEGHVIIDGVEYEEELVPFFRAPTADLNMTLALSLLTFSVVQFAGVSAHGVKGRIKHMADPPFLFPIEVISEFSRIISLSARLFGNVFAGEVLLGVMYAMGAAIKIAVLPFLFPVVFLGLEVMFGTIQALVFGLLTLIYITLAAAGHDDHDEKHADDGDAAHGKTAHAATSGD
ncbi:MAG: F0F1 ATP synthase subunit A [Thermomicrobiales bacterium]